MDKYSGCNVVESVVKSADRPQKVKAGKHKRTFFIRLGLAVVAVGAILVLHYVPIAAFESVKTALRSVFCYDVFGRSVFGTSGFFG